MEIIEGKSHWYRFVKEGSLCASSRIRLVIEAQKLTDIRTPSLTITRKSLVSRTNLDLTEYDIQYQVVDE